MTGIASTRLRDCTRCPRLVAHHAEVRQSYPEYHAAPVGSWGDPRAKIVVVGLAPGLHGAARTGRAFVGDASGNFLFAALHRHGFSTSAEPANAQLRNMRITNVVKCLPPGNAPTATEVNTCAAHLELELMRYFPPGARQPRVLITLGGVAHRAVARNIGLKEAGFGHAAVHRLSAKRHVISSFHPSRLNVNTGRLTAPMFDEVFTKAKALLG